MSGRVSLQHLHNPVLLVVIWVAMSLIAAPARSHEATRDAASNAQKISAFYMFRSWDSPDKLVMIMSVARGQHPAEGPEYFQFADNTVYRFSIDNDLNGLAANVVYEIEFKSEHRPIAGGHPWPYVAIPNGLDPSLKGITALTGNGSEGLTLRQVYSVTQISGGRRTQLFKGKKLIAVPPNVGAATMPAYEALAAQGIFLDPKTGIRVFAGQRAETAFGDVGALFDAGNLRRNPPFLTAAEDANGLADPFGTNRFFGANVMSIAIEVPITQLTRDGKAAAKTAIPLLGAYASVLQKDSRHDDWNGRHDDGDGLRQVSRMGNPSFRTFIVDTETKSRWDASRPENDAQFQDLLKAPAIARLLQSSYGVPVPPEPRLELVQIILKYPNQPTNGADCGTPCSDLLRINLQAPPTPAEQQQRLGALLSPDPAGLPNGCRPNDDLTDISLRAFGGPAYFAARIGDGVNSAGNVPGTGFSDGPGYGSSPGNKLDVAANGVVKEFPFMPTPYDGRDGG